MVPSAAAPLARWYRSFYFRIGFVFVVFVVVVVIAQNAIFGLMAGVSCGACAAGRP